MPPVKFTGVFPIVITPFDADENPDLVIDSMSQLSDHL